MNVSHVLGEFELDTSGKIQKRDANASGAEYLKREHHDVSETELSSKLRTQLRDQSYRAALLKINRELALHAVMHSADAESFIIQTISVIEDQDKIINMMGARLRDWVDLFDPFLSRKLHDTEKLVNHLLNNELHKVNPKITKADYTAMMQYTKHVHTLIAQRFENEQYVRKKLEACAPNLLAVAGTTIGAKLLRHAGSMKKLALFPSSTMQVLGAEKALFRHLRNKKNKAPKYGLIHEHPAILKTKGKQGRAARLLADKLTIAARIDFFKGEFKGDELKADLSKKLGLEL